MLGNAAVYHFSGHQLPSSTIFLLVVCHAVPSMAFAPLLGYYPILLFTSDRRTNGIDFFSLILVRLLD